MATSQVSISGRDYSEEASKLSMHVDAITAANHDATVASAAALASAVETITDALVTKYQIVHSVTKLSNQAGSSDAESRRERKMMVQYEDDVSKNLYQFEVFSPDMSALTYDGKTDDVLLADGGAMAAFVTAVEANAVSPEGNSITITKATVTGRLL